MPELRKPGPPRLKKALGQHHLRHPELCRELLAFLRLKGATVVEIGPGGGILTTQLLARAQRVWAVEIDPSWAFHLAVRLDSSSELPASPPGPGTQRLGLVVADALEFPWCRLPEGTRVTGNLPYSASTALIERLAAHSNRLGPQGFLVQLEVAQRLCAAPGEAPYGSLSVIVASRLRCRMLNRVKPGSFQPPPRVDSAFIALEAREPLVPIEQWPAFKRLVRLAFSRRRKTILNSLSSGMEKSRAAALLEHASIEPGRRAQTVSLEEFALLHHAAIDAPVHES